MQSRERHSRSVREIPSSYLVLDQLDRDAKVLEAKSRRGSYSLVVVEVVEVQLAQGGSDFLLHHVVVVESYWLLREQCPARCRDFVVLCRGLEANHTILFYPCVLNSNRA